MATPEQRKEKIEEVQEKLNKLAGIDPKKLSRTAELSRDINFSESVQYFEEILDTIKQLQQRDITRLGFTQLNQIVASCSQVSTLIKLVEDFTLNQNTPADVCKSIVEQVKNAYDTIIEPLALPLAFTATQATDYAKIEREAKGYHATMQNEAESFKTLLGKYQSEAEKALSAVKAQAAEAGVATNAQIFLKDSESHHGEAKEWLIATIIVAGVTLLTAIGFVMLSFYYNPPSTASAIQYVVSKLVLLSTLSFGLFWCASNYKSQKHNETLNKHRANALMTFRAFVEGSEDSQVKDAILLQAAQAAFTNRPTGFDSQEKEPQNISPVVEIFGKSLVKSAQ